MRTNVRIGTAGLMVLLLLPGVQAASVEADLAATSLHAEGHARSEGTLLGLLVDTQYGTGVANPSFFFEASQLRVETDYVDIATSTGPIDYAHGPDTASDTYHKVRVLGLEYQDDYQTFVVPLDGRAVPRLGIQATCSVFTPADSASVERGMRVRADQRPDLIIDTAKAAKWSGCASQATITGDFLVVMWGHDAQLTTPTESKRLESGRLASEQSPHPALDAAVHRRQQLFLYAMDATLQFPLTPGEYGLYLTNATTQTEDATFTLQDARGQLHVLGDEVRLGGERLTLTGSLHAQALDASVGESMQFIVTGQLITGYRDGEPLAFTTPVQVTSTVTWTILAMALAATVLLLAWWVPLLQYKSQPSPPEASMRQRHAWTYNRRGLKQYNEGRFLRAWLWANLASALDSCAKHIHLRCQAATSLGLRRSAMRDHARLDGLLRDPFNRLENAHQARDCAEAWNLPQAAKKWQERIQEHEAPFLDPIYS